jgi:hypothetical protein
MIWVESYINEKLCENRITVFRENKVFVHIPLQKWGTRPLNTMIKAKIVKWQNKYYSQQSEFFAIHIIWICTDTAEVDNSNRFTNTIYYFFYIKH